MTELQRTFILFCLIIGLAGLGNFSIYADTLYSSGTFTWDTSTSNWGSASGGPYNTSVWSNINPDDAVLESTAGTVTVSVSITAGNLSFTNRLGDGEYTLNGSTLNFSSSSVIINDDNRLWQTITNPITGSPMVETRDDGAGNQYKGIRFQPSSGTVTPGNVLNPNNTGGTDKSGFALAGTTVGNSVGHIDYAGGDRYGTVYKEDSGTWTTGNIRTGTLRIYDGRLILNGETDLDYQGLSVTGGMLSGNATIYKADRRSTFNFPSGSGVAPGDGVGTITFDWGTNGSPNASQWATSFRSGSEYEWEVGVSSNDVVHITDGRLIVEGFTLKVVDAGGAMNPNNQYSVFTYGSLDSKTLDLANVVFDTTEIGNLDTSEAMLVDDGAGTIYLTGLGIEPKGTIFSVQ